MGIKFPEEWEKLDERAQAYCGRKIGTQLHEFEFFGDKLHYCKSCGTVKSNSEIEAIKKIIYEESKKNQNSIHLLTRSE